MVRKNSPPISEFSERLAGLLLRGADTSKAIHWDQLAKSLNDAPSPVTEEVRVRLFVQMLNGTALTATQFNQLVGLPLMHGAVTEYVRLPQTDLDGLARSLRILLEGSPKAREAAEAIIRGRIVLVPEGDSVRVVAADLRAALTYSLLRASANTRLVCCPQCGRFFFRKPNRGAPRKFCSVKCGREADDAIAAERMRARRKAKTRNRRTER